MGVNVTDGSLNFVAGLDITAFERNAQRMEDRINNLSQASMTQSRQIENIANKAAQAAAAYFSVASATTFVNKLIQVRGEFEQLSVAYATILGSKAKADDLFAETVKLAATTPLGLTELAKSTKQLLAYGFGAEEVTNTLSKLGDVAAGVSAPIGDIAYLYGTLKTQGRAYAQDIRQFTGRGIPIIKELAEQFHTTAENVNVLVEAGKVGFPEIEKAFNKLTGSGGQFFNLMEKQSKTLTGQISNLGDAFDQMLNEIGQSNEGILKGGVAGLAELVRNYKQVIDIIEMLIITYGAYRAAIIATSAFNSFQGLRTVTEVVQRFNGATMVSVTVTRELTVAQTLQAAASKVQASALAFVRSEAFLTATALGAITAAIAIVVGSVYAWTEATALTNKAQEDFNKISKITSDSLTAEKVKLNDLIALAADHTSSLSKRAGAITKINQISPEYLGNITLENIGTRESVNAINDYLKALDKKLQGEAAYSAKLENVKRINDLKTRGKDALTASEFAGLAIQDVAEGLNPFDGKGGLFNGGDRAKALVDKVIKSYQDANDKINKVYGQQIKDNLVEGKAGTDAQIQQALLFQKNLKDVVTNFNTLLKTQTGKKDLEAIKKALDEALDIPNITRQKIEQIKTLQQKTEDALAIYSRKADKKLADQQESELQRRNAIFEKIAKVNETAIQESVSQDEKEVLQARAKYDELLRIIDKYNKDKRNKTKIDPFNVTVNGVRTNINTEANNAEDVVRAKQAFEITKQGYEKQKTLFKEFENYKTEVGEEIAKKRFSNDIQGFTSYISFLEGLAKDVAGKTDNKSILTQDFLKKELPAARNEELKAQQDHLSDLLKSTLTYADRANIIIDKTNKDAALLRKQGYDDQARIAELQGELELDNLHADNEAQINSYRNFYQQLEGLTVEQSRLRIAEAQRVSLAEFLAGKISEEAYLKIIKLIEEGKKAINNNVIVGGLNALSSAFTEISNSLQPLNSDIASTFKSIADGFSIISKLDSNISTLKKNFASFASDKAAGGGGFFGTVSAITKSIPVIGSIIGTVVTGVGAIVELFSKSKEKAEQAAYLQQIQAKQIEAVNKALERQLALNKEIYGTERLTAYQKSLVDIKKAQQDTIDYLTGKFTLTGDKKTDDFITRMNDGAVITDKYYADLIKKLKETGAIIDITGKSLEELQKLADSGALNDNVANAVKRLVELKQQFTDTMNALNAEAVGSTFQSQLDNIVSLFQNVTTTAQDFADNLQKIIQQSVINTFKRQFLETQLQGFYDQFAVFAKSGGVVDASELSQLEKYYNAVIKKAQTDFDALQKATGVKFTNGSASKSPNSAVGAIGAAITEDTGNIIAGGIKGIQLNTYQTNLKLDTHTLSFGQMLMIAQDNLNLAIKIEQNTKRTADNTDKLPPMLDELKSINASSKGGTDILTRAAGFYKF